MKKGRKEILESMLKFSNYYWYDAAEDSVSNQLINVEDYDPVVDIIFKANAYELEKIYSEIEDSDERILDNLVNTLIPDHNLLPSPAFTVAKIQPKFSRLKISPEDVFKIEGKDDIGTQVEYYFTTIGHHEYPKSEIAYLLTDNVCKDYSNGEPTLLEDVIEAQPYKRTKTLWLGIDIEDEIEDNDKLTFFLGSEILDAFNYDAQIFNKAKWHINGETELPLNVQIGVQHFFNDDDDDRKYEVSKFIEQKKNLYEQQIINFFDSSFITISGLPVDLSDLKKTKPYLIENLNTEKWNNEKKLFWIKASFDAPISNKFIIENQFYLNAILLVNRKLKKQQIVKNNFDRILLPLPTEDYFLSINSIWDEKSKINDEKTHTYKAVDYINFKDEPGTYTVRPGNSVRRVDQHDISTKIVNLLDLIEEEYSSFKEGGVNRLKEDFDAIEKSVNRIRKQLPNIYESESERTAFYCVANFRKNASIITYNYWETQGDKVDALATKKGLEVSSDYISLDDSYTITAIQKGRASVNKINYHNNLKKAILSRNKIVTIGDIENYCYNTYPDLIKNLRIEKRIEAANNPNKYENIIAVQILLNEEATKNLDTAFVKLQIQNGLNANTTFYTPIRVQFSQKL